MNPLLAGVSRYYTAKVQQHGATFGGVDWNSDASQILRFRQLLKVIDTDDPFTLNDYGCGYGALVDYMVKSGLSFRYRGFDISEEMVRAARQSHAASDSCEFVSSEDALSPADYTVASGVFNVKLESAV